LNSFGQPFPVAPRGAPKGDMGCEQMEYAP
jgi:hypothetical protein